MDEDEEIEIHFIQKGPDSFEKPETVWIDYCDFFATTTNPEDRCFMGHVNLISIDKNVIQTSKEITIWVSKICKPFEHDLPICFHFERDNWSGFVILCCAVIRLFKFDVKQAITYIRSCFYIQTDDNFRWNPDKQNIWLINNYKPPIKVLFCGDRNSAACFEDVIAMELKALPLDSILVHGGCKGVDLYSAELARLAGIETKEFAVTREDWALLGRAAGPLRNTMMLKEGIDYVIAYHPEIEMSKGTKDMMVQAWQSGIPVYIHDLKRKSKFEGDFSVL